MEKDKEISVEISPIWLFEDTDLSKCHICDEIIYSRMWRMWIEFNKGIISLPMHKTGIVLCESCKNKSNV